MSLYHKLSSLANKTALRVQILQLTSFEIDLEMKRGSKHSIFLEFYYRGNTLKEYHADHVIRDGILQSNVQKELFRLL